MNPSTSTRPSRLLTLALAALVPACESPEEVQEAIVASVRYPCMGLGPMLCLSYTEGGEQETLYQRFEGLTHRWGVSTRIHYHVEPVDEVLQDAPSQRYIVDEIVEETLDDIGSKFELTFMETGGGGWFVASGMHVRMIDTEVECEPDVCARVLDLTDAGKAFTAQFKLTADPDVPLRLLAVSE